MSWNKALTGVVTTTAGGVTTSFATIATDSFFANITAGTTAPTTVAFTTIDSASLIWDAATHTFQRAAMTGEVTSSQNSNTTVVVRSTGFTWTGAHVHNGASHTIDVSGASNITAGAQSTIQTTAGNLILNSTAAGSRVAITGQDDVLVAATDDSVFINAGVNVAVAPANSFTAVAGGNIAFTAAGLFRVTTNAVERLEIEPDGAWQLGGDTGITSEIITSTGSTTPPAWQIPVAFNTIFSSTLTAQVNDLAIGDVNVVRLGSTGGPHNLTGMVPPRNGQLVIVLNASTTTTIRVVDESDATDGSDSSAANRFALFNSTSQTLLAESMTIFWYDTTASRWRTNQ